MESDHNNSEYHILNFDGSEFKTCLSKKFLNHKPYSPPNYKKIYAFIPGTIINVTIKEKRKIKKGEQLVVLQAMKMNNIISSRIDGTVKKIYVKKGDIVPKNSLLVELK